MVRFRITCHSRACRFTDCLIWEVKGRKDSKMTKDFGPSRMMELLFNEIGKTGQNRSGDGNQ